MQLYCQSCQAAFAGMSHCPRCGNRLLAPQESFIHNPSAKKPPPDPIPSTFANRLALGLLVGLGVAMGLRELHAAALMLSNQSVGEGWTDSNSQPSVLAMRLIAVLCGGLLAGAGRHAGLPVGAACGLAFGVILTGFDIYAAGSIRSMMEFAMLPAFIALAAIAGAIGAWVWPADVILPEPVRASSHGSSLAALAVEEAALATERPTNWFAILPGAMLVMIGVMASDPIRMTLFKYSNGWLNTGGLNRGADIGLQIAAIAAMIGGFVAGAGSTSGLKHGLLAAMLAGAGLLIGARNRADGLFPALEGFLKLFTIEPEPLSSPRIAISVMLGLFMIMGVFGWLGSQLLPPLAPKSMRVPRLRRGS